MDEKQGIENILFTPVAESEEGSGTLTKDTSAIPFEQSERNPLQKTDSGITPLTKNVSNSKHTQTHSAASKKPSLEENHKTGTKEPDNSVTGVALHSNIGEPRMVTDPVEKYDKTHYKLMLASSLSTGHTFVPVKEHSMKVKKLQSQVKSMETQKQLEEDENKELKESIEELHQKKKKLRTQTSQKLEELKELHQDCQETDDKLKTLQEQERFYKKRCSLLEDELRVAKEEIECIKRENEDFRREYSMRLEEERRQRQALEVRVNELKDILNKTCLVGNLKL